MILVTSDEVPNQKIIKCFGLVRGNTVRARNIGKDIAAFIKNILGGEIEEYTALLAQSREQALDRMIDSAQKLGANAIVAIRFTTSEIMQNAAEIMVYGTAVLVEEL